MPNSSLPPGPWMCSVWTLALEVTDEWTFVALPWQSWHNDNSNLAALGIDTTAVGPVGFTAPPCHDLELWVREIDSYRVRL